MSSRNTVITSVALSWGVTIATLFAVQWLPGPWKLRFLQADTVSIGGGPGQGSIVLSAERGLGGMAMATLKGAPGGDSLTLSVGSMGSPAITLDSASGKPALVLELPPNGQPRIRLMDAATGQKGWSVTLDANGQPVIEPR